MQSHRNIKIECHIICSTDDKEKYDQGDIFPENKFKEDRLLTLSKNLVRKYCFRFHEILTILAH